MNPAVHHVLLTRFNLPSVGVESLIRAQDGWLRDRVALFERYCLPSVTAQTNRNFFWVVYFDTESPAWLVEKISRWGDAGTLIPRFRTSVPPADLVADIREVLGEQRPHLLTTNLDNDDALAVDFVDRLQAVPPTDGPQAVYLTHGLIKSGDAVYERRDRHNAFVSVLEPSTQPRTCWSDWHNLLARSMPVVEVAGRPGWLQVIHGTNVSNRVRGRLTDPSQYEDLFPGHLDDVARPRASALLRDRFVTAPLRVGKEAGRSAAKWAVMRTIGKSGLDRAKLTLARMRSGSPDGSA